MKTRKQIQSEIMRINEKIKLLKRDMSQKTDNNVIKPLRLEAYRLETYLEALEWVLGRDIENMKRVDSFE